MEIFIVQQGSNDRYNVYVVIPRTSLKGKKALILDKEKQEIIEVEIDEGDQAPVFDEVLGGSKMYELYCAIGKYSEKKSKPYNKVFSMFDIVDLEARVKREFVKGRFESAGIQLIAFDSMEDLETKVQRYQEKLLQHKSERIDFLKLHDVPYIDLRFGVAVDVSHFPNEEIRNEFDVLVEKQMSESSIENGIFGAVIKATTK